jgi:aminoglycoside phosphotransferase (APT) family kinase protein
MTAQTTSIDNEAVERHLIAWVERTLGVQVKSVERQNRWRPAWFLEIAGSPAVEQLYVRGERTTKSVMFPLEYEFRVLQILEANGILVPHVYGMCPDPMAIVMSKAPGRADLSTAANDDVRCSVMDHYIDQLAAIHAIDASAFEAVGLERPVGPTAIALEFFEQYVELTVNRNDARNRSWNFS